VVRGAIKDKIANASDFVSVSSIVTLSMEVSGVVYAPAEEVESLADEQERILASKESLSRLGYILV